MTVSVYSTRPPMPLPDVCCRTNCSNAAEFQPVICIWAKVDWKHRPDTCIRMELGLVVCGPCSKKMQARDLLSDEGWQQITKAVTGIGKAEPDRESAVLELRPLPGRN